MLKTPPLTNPLFPVFPIPQLLRGKAIRDMTRAPEKIHEGELCCKHDILDVFVGPG